MMEEVSDDTNGESSFEFVSRKIDETTSKDENQSVTSPEQSIVSTPISPSDASRFPMPLPNLTAPAFSIPTQKTDSNITFYSVNPQDNKSVMLPPLIPAAAARPQYLPSAPSVNVPQTQYATVQQSYSPTTSLPQNYQDPQPQQPYYSPPVQHSLSLPFEQSEVLAQESSEGGVWGWFKGKEFLNKVAEKAKNSVDSVITTLDPGMKEIINTGGDINVIVASGNEDKISAVREAFQHVFGKATVQGIPVQSNSIAPQPVGFSAGLSAAEERISNLKQLALAQDKQIFLSIENFLAELTPEKWFDIGCLLLQDQSSGISLQIYTEAIPISSQYVDQAKSQTPPDYPLGWSGFAVTIGQIMGPALGVHHSLWHQALTGVSRREILFLAAKTMAGLYRSHLRR